MSNISMHSVAGTGGHQNRRHATYAAIVDELSNTPQQPELYSRVQYQFLARYLSAAPTYSPYPQNADPVHVQGRARQITDAFIHVVVHTFLGGNQLRRHDFNLKDGLKRLVEHPQLEPHSDQIVFVRGSLSPAWIEALGTKYKIDPEFFRRHLRYMRGWDYSDLPSLPSANTNIMTLVLPSLYNWSNPISLGQIRKFREKDSEVARRNQTSIARDKACGETVIRRFSTLNDRLFSVEHEISIFRRSRRTDGSQIVVVLLDNGLEMNQENGPPCFNRQDSTPSGASTDITPIPVIVPRPPTLNINVVHPAVPIHYDPVSRNSIGHVASLLPFYLGTSTNQPPAASSNQPSTAPSNPPSTAPSTPPDVFALICEVFRLVAGSECQFLNQLRCIVQDQELDPADKENMNLATNTLRHIKSLLEDHKQCLKQNIAFLKTRCSADLNAGSPPAASSSTQTQRTQSPDDLTSILIDFKELLTRAEDISAFCTETADLILNGD
ncbi:hypothetical protein VE03_00898 [Pseudogymnoascus sp. 23342-1-I1]|nr:hypothetical protein VE03_00898 [Pseudogymnoascus sp. 23342-1-I1]